MVQWVTGTGLASLKDSPVIGGHQAKTYYKQVWLAKDFIVFNDKVKMFQQAVRAGRKHPHGHFVKFGVSCWIAELLRWIGQVWIRETGLLCHLE